MDNQRLILVIALSMVLLLLWQAWENEHRPPAARTATANPQAVTPSAPDTSGVPAAPALPGSDAATTEAAPAPGAPAAPAANSPAVAVKTDLFALEIATVGGTLRRLDLLQYPVAADKPDQPVRLLNSTGAEIFMVQSGLIGNDGTYPHHKTTFVPERSAYELPAGQDRLEVRLNWSGDGMRVAKVFTFYRNSYRIDVRYEVTNQDAKPRGVYAYHQLLRTHVAGNDYFNVAPSYVGGAIYTPEKKYEKIGFDDIVDKWSGRTVTGGWVAMLQHYFVGALLPPAAETHQFYSDTLPGARYVLGYKTLAPTTVAPGATAAIESQYYIGPKEQQRLEKAAPGLVLTVDYGWLTVISAPLYWVLEKIERAVGNWGWAIVILTFLIKLAFYPLSAASYKSMAQMRQLQPRLVALKERYGSDRQKMNQAMMDLYKTEKINPLGGCLPILIQIPVFIALYWVLLESVELRQAPFILWIDDLSAPDPYFVLPIIMGVTMVLQQMMNPAPLDPIQKKIMMALPVLFTVFFLFFASGLVLYWVVNNILSIAQQWWITRRIEAGAKA